jgi:hypothetical protein
MMAANGRRAAALALVAAASISFAAPTAAAARHRVVFAIQPAEIDESSSLVVSTTHPGLVYTANDSGDSATVYALDDKGALVGSTELAGVSPFDIEAMAAGSDGSLVVADVGDNARDRANTTVYRIDQPDRGTHVVTPDAVSVRLSTGPHDAEGALYDASSGRLFVVTKQLVGARVYRSPADVFSRDRAVMRPMAAAPAVATDATFIHDGSVAVIRGYFTAYFYSYPGWHKLADLALPAERQGESVAAARDGRHLWIGSEGEHSKVLAVSIPRLTTPTPPPTQPTTAPPTSAGSAASDDADRDARKSRALLVGGVALALLVIVVVVVAVRYHRHPSEH